MTHGCIKVIGKHGEVVWLYTYHTGQDIKLVIESIFGFVVENRKYIKEMYSKEKYIEPTKYIAEIFKSDGNLCDWFEYAPYVASLIIASTPLRYHVASLDEKTPKWFNLNPTVIRCGLLEWYVTYEDGSKSKYDVVVEMANKVCPQC